jgi:hypothetical protein
VTPPINFLCPNTSARRRAERRSPLVAPIRCRSWPLDRASAHQAVEIVAVLQPKPHCTHVMEIIHPSLGHGNVRSLARKNKQSKARHGDCTLRVANLGSGK